MRVDNSKIIMKGDGEKITDEGEYLVTITWHKEEEKEVKEKIVDSVCYKFTTNEGAFHFESFNNHPDFAWKLRRLSEAFGIGKDEVWDSEDLLNKRLIIVLKRPENSNYDGLNITVFKPENSIPGQEVPEKDIDDWD